MSSVKPLFYTWFISTFFGWLLGFVAIVALAVAGEAVGLGGTQFIIGAGAGVGVGFMQARVLRKFYGVSWFWMWASMLGMATGFAIMEFGSRIHPLMPEYSLTVSVAVGGLLTGLLQFRVLKKVTSRYMWWIVISFVGWSSASFVVYVNDMLGHSAQRTMVTSIVAMLLLIFGPGIALGILTGLGARKILSY